MVSVVVVDGMASVVVVVLTIVHMSWILENSRPNYRVLATDYLNYAIVYDCFDIFGLFKAESLWLLTRAETPEQGLVDQAYK